MLKMLKFSVTIIILYITLTTTISKINTKDEVAIDTAIINDKNSNVACISDEEDCIYKDVKTQFDHPEELEDDSEDSDDDDEEMEYSIRRDKVVITKRKWMKDEIGDRQDKKETTDDEEEGEDSSASYEPNIFIQNPCIDLDKDCSLLASEGKCITDQVYMLYNCQKSCFVCLDEIDYHEKECKDDDPIECPNKAFEGECESNPIEMKNQCPLSCGYCISSFETGVPQYFDNDEIDHISVLQTISTSNIYLIEEVLTNPKHARIKDSCYNEDNYCSSWAATDECLEDPDFMHFNCPLACRTCDTLDIDIRCPLDHDRLNKANTWRQGDLEKMFMRFMNDPYYAQYGPKVLSQPNDTEDTCSLWVMTFDNFITEEECDRMIELAAEEGYERSTTVSWKIDNVDGGHEGAENSARTSENSWCGDECNADPLVQGVIDRIANVTGIPKQNQESFQLLKYEVGQFYTAHVDYIPFRADGPRIATFFIYLNNVTSGGETAFPNLGVKVTPKKGKALIFPSVKNLDPMEEDRCSRHEALPVIEGVKHAANVWIHMRNFQNARDDNGCPSFDY